MSDEVSGAEAHSWEWAFLVSHRGCRVAQLLSADFMLLALRWHLRRGEGV